MGTYQIPKRFYDDHCARGCGESGIITKTTKTHYVVVLDEAAFNDLVSDCDYYVDMQSELDRCYLGLVASARATLKILAKQPVEMFVWPKVLGMSHISLVRKVDGKSEATGFESESDAKQYASNNGLLIVHTTRKF